MDPGFVIQTRQKQDVLFELPKGTDDLTLPLDAATPVTIGPMLVSGYAELRFAGVMDQAFTVEVQEACDPEGTFFRTALFTSVAASPASAGQRMCEFHKPCALYARVIVTNTGPAATTRQELCGSGLPVL